MASPTDQGCVDWFSYGGSSPVPTIDYHTFMTQAKALTIPTGRRAEVSYEVQLPGPGQEFEPMKASEIAALECPVLFWEHENTSTPPKSRGLRSRNYFAQQAQHGKAVVLLTSRQATASFTKRVPAAIDGRGLAAELATAFIAEMTDDERAMIHDSITGGGDRRAAETIHQVFRTNLNRIDSACALGVHLTRMNQIRDQRASESFTDLLTKRSAVSYWIDVPAPVPTRPEFVQQHLPLLHALLQNWRSMACTGQFWDHLFAYINSIRT